MDELTEMIERSMRFRKLISNYNILDYPLFSAACKICHATVSTITRYFPEGESPLEKHMEWHDEQERLRTSTSV